MECYVRHLSSLSLTAWWIPKLQTTQSRPRRAARSSLLQGLYLTRQPECSVAGGY
jgi:hypothetical protein